MRRKTPRVVAAKAGRRALITVLVCAVVVTAGGWVGAQFITTPQQVAARARPPAPSVLTADVESRVVSDTVVTRGDVGYSHVVNVLAGRTVAGAAATVITALPIGIGGEIQPGAVLAQLSGRPVFALTGAFPAYRDLSEGLVGPDVEQLQAALAEIGIKGNWDKKAVFGRGTAIAVSKLYDKAGYAKQESIPRSELAFIPQFPVQVASSTAYVGATVSTVALNIAQGSLVVKVKADREITLLAQQGGAVEIASEVLNKTVAGTVAGLQGEAPASTGSDSNEADAAVEPAPAAGTSDFALVQPAESLTADWAGQNVRVTFLKGSTAEKVLAVPLTAVSTRADGTTQIVLVSQEKGKTVRTPVAVQTGVTGAGYVELRSTASPINPGEKVEVGAK